MLPSPSVARAALVAGLLVLSLSACGRRGAPEAPPDPSAPKVEPGVAGDSGGVLPSPIGTPRTKSNRRGYTIPKDPFILDPIL
jgi:predicted small lipoprotein YifL